jgi:hypothetical protein
MSAFYPCQHVSISAFQLFSIWFGAFHFPNFCFSENVSVSSELLIGLEIVMKSL